MMWFKTTVHGVFAAALLFAALAGFGAVRAEPSVGAIRIGVHSDKLRVVLEASEKLPVTAFELGTPYRIVLDLPDIDWRVDPSAGEAARGFVGGFRFGRFAPGQSRMVLDLRRPALVDKTFHIPGSAGKPWRLVVDLKPVTADVFAQRLAQPDAAARGQSPTRAAVLVPTVRPKPEGPAPKKVVVIDPGHGGIDPGAVGRSGIYEKRVTLAMGLQLRRELMRRGRYEVVMTRQTDTFVRLRERVAMARAAGGDLFISLHADSNPKRSVRGASVYTLSEKASDKEAADLAAKENRADVIAGMDLTGESAEVANILIDLTQRETMNHSAVFAKDLVNDLRRATKLLRKTHRFAGFAVLKAPDIPSVLIEMGYLSNATDEGRLIRAEYRAELAKTIAAAVDRFFDRDINQPRP